MSWGEIITVAFLTSAVASIFACLAFGWAESGAYEPDENGAAGAGGGEAVAPHAADRRP